MKRTNIELTNLTNATKKTKINLDNTCINGATITIDLDPLKGFVKTEDFETLKEKVEDLEDNVIKRWNITEEFNNSNEVEFNIGETSDRWNTLNTKEEMTMKEWHDTLKDAESIVKKLDTYYLGILKQKIADYSHFTIEEFHEVVSELLMIQYAEEEKKVEQERMKELEEERESEALKKGNKRSLLSEKDSLLANALIHISLNFNEATDKSEDFLSEVRQLINRYTYNSGEFSKFFDLSFVDDE